MHKKTKMMKNKHTAKRKLYGLFTIIAMILTIISAFIYYFIRDGIIVDKTKATFGWITYVLLVFTGIFLYLEIKYSDKEEKENL